jgi:tryptophan synthase beta subunit
MESGYAYEIYKQYIEIFPAVTMRSIYYHLRKGVETGEFIVKDIRREKGEYSWGSEAEKTYYALGNAAAPKMLPKVREYFEKKRPKISL